MLEVCNFNGVHWSYNDTALKLPLSTADYKQKWIIYYKTKHCIDEIWYAATSPSTDNNNGAEFRVLLFHLCAYRAVNLAETYSMNGSINLNCYEK